MLREQRLSDPQGAPPQTYEMAGNLLFDPTLYPLESTSHSDSKPINIPTFSSSDHRFNFESLEEYNRSGRNSPSNNPYTPSYGGSFNSYGSAQDHDFGGRAQQHHSPNLAMIDNMNFGEETEYDHRDYDALDDANAMFLLQHNDSGLDTESYGYQSQQQQQTFSHEHREYSVPSPASSNGVLDDIGRSPGNLSIGLHSPAFPSNGELPLDMGPLSFDNSSGDPPAIPSWASSIQNVDDGGHQPGSPSGPQFFHTAPSPPAFPPPSPTTKPQSPPQLVIPDTQTRNSQNATSLMPPSMPGVPSFDSHQRNAMGGHPLIHIVPSTPVSGGGAAGTTTGGFQDVLENLTGRRSSASTGGQAPSQGKW